MEAIEVSGETLEECGVSNPATVRRIRLRNGHVVDVLRSTWDHLQNKLTIHEWYFVEFTSPISTMDLLKEVDRRFALYDERNDCGLR